MTSGRKRIPTALKLIKGNTGRRPLPPDEPKFDPDRPSPPPWLSDEAKVEWGRLIDVLYIAGLMTVVDRAVFAAYCDAYATFEVTGAALDEMRRTKGSTIAGFLTKTKNDNVIQSPLLGIHNKARDDMVRFAAEFGMGAAARSRVSANGSKVPPANPLAEFFG
jgi:P27 family predicted phage terminase small subunit